MRAKKYILSVLLVLIALLVVLMPYFAHADQTKTEKEKIIPKGVYAGDISIGGMTEAQASDAVNQFIEELKQKKVTLRAGGNEIETTMGELGLSWKNQDIIREASGIGSRGNLLVRYKEMKDLEQQNKIYDIAYVVEKSRITRLLNEKKESLTEEAVDAGLKREGNSFVITPEKEGIAVNVEESANEAAAFFEAEWDGSDVVLDLKADVVKPRATEEELAKVKDLLGSYHTTYATSNAGRRQNVENGTSKIDGSIVFPGEEFSAYEATSPYEKENGYGIGGAYENGKVIDSYGGGICQVSTTLYNAVIRAELEITERFPHSMTVTYVKPSEDAAIAGTYKDLKFINNTDAPIYIEGYTANGEVYFNIFGHETRAANRTVTFESEVLSTTDPGVQYQATGEQPIGYIAVDQTEHVGYSAKLWKIVAVDGVEQSREVFNTSTYKPSARIVLVGTASANPQAVAAINGAIASQDEGTIRAAADQWNDGALAAQAAAEQAQAAQAAEQAAQSTEEQPEEEPQEEGEEEPEPGSQPEEEPQDKEKPDESVS